MRHLHRPEAFLNGNRRKAIMLLHVLFVFLAYSLAFGLRFELDIPEAEQRLLIKTLPFLLICRLSTYYIFNLNSGWCRFPDPCHRYRYNAHLETGKPVYERYKP